MLRAAGALFWETMPPTSPCPPSGLPPALSAAAPSSLLCPRFLRVQLWWRLGLPPAGPLRARGGREPRSSAFIRRAEAGSLPGPLAPARDGD